MNATTPTTIMTRDEARTLQQQLIVALRERGLIGPNETGVPSNYGTVDWSIDYAWDRKLYRRQTRVPDHERSYGVVLTTGQYRSSTPPKKRKLHRTLEPMLMQITREVNAHVEEHIKKGERRMDKAQKDFDRGWCAFRRGIVCKLINGNFHALVRVGADEVWQDDVEYSTSHDTLVFRSEIGKVDRWITIETLQLLLDRGVLLNPADVKF